MGIDLCLYVIKPPGLTDEQLAAADAFLVKNAPTASPNYYNHGKAIWSGVRAGDVILEVYSLCRLFSPWYRRGYWPDIFQSIKAMEAAFPGCVVRYGADTDSNDVHAEPCDELFIEQQWAAWTTHTEGAGRTT